MREGEQHTQEIRFAIVLYGGVSLAVYINGVVQELLRLVRSTSGQPLPEVGSENAYRKLASVLERGVIPTDGTDPDSVIRTKFQVDIISGTSAGGINGIFLAKALANNSDLSQIQQLWFEQGDIEMLLNDARSYKNVGPRPADTTSLLNSRRMYVELLRAFDGMDTGNRVDPSRDVADSPLAEDIDLFATTTDIDGIAVPIQLFDNVVFERRHRNVFQFRYRQNERNDFQADNNPFLAFAARCTSSFPFAFEPMQLCNIDSFIKTGSIYPAKFDYCKSGSARWKKFFTNYLDGVLPTATPFPERPFGDGGYLNNAPFSYAVDALLARQAEVPVERKLLYVEPSPDHPEEQPDRSVKPNAIENSVAALITIPGYQSIRTDLMRVLERNRVAAKVAKAVSQAEFRVQRSAHPCRAPEGWAPEIHFEGSDCFQPYYQLRATDVTDQLATMVARMSAIEETSAYFLALRSVIRAWRETVYGVDARMRATQENADSDLQQFLTDFDLPYRVRRLRLVLRKLDALYGLTLDPEHPSFKEAEQVLAFGLGAKEPLLQMPENVRAVRSQLARQAAVLRRILTALLDTLEPPDADTPEVALRKRVEDPATIVRSRLPKREDLVGFLAQIMNSPKAGARSRTTEPVKRDPKEPSDIEALYDERARKLLVENPILLTSLREMGNSLRDMLASFLAGIHAGVGEVFAADGAGEIARHYYFCFDHFDAIQFPMTFGTDVTESDEVDIVRICPEDAPSLMSSVDQRRAKLKGLLLHHFGAFLEEDWRVSDLLWGRLDAAERIITALLPYSPGLRDQLIDEAHNEILRQFGADEKLREIALKQAVSNGPQSRLTDANVENVIKAVVPAPPPLSRTAHQDFMQTWMSIIPEQMNPTRMVASLARSTEIMGRMLEGIAANTRLSGQAAWITNLGRAFWGVVELSIPRSAGTILGRYWQSLLIVIGLLLILAGLVSGQASLSGVGWTCLAIALALALVRNALGSAMRGRNAWRSLRSVFSILLLVVFALGAFTTYGLVCRGWNFLQVRTNSLIHAGR